jgi:ribosomal protein S27AE
VECLNCGKQVLAYKLDEQGLCGQCTGNEDWEQE